jgi:hypothetical protein
LLKQNKIRGFENDLYYFSRVLFRRATFKGNDRTISQLKSAGSFRLIKNHEVVDSILSYQKAVEEMERPYAAEREEVRDMFPITAQIFNAFEFEDMVSETGIKRHEGKVSLLTYERGKQIELAFYIHQIKGTALIIKNRLEEMQRKAINLVAILKKDYRLK